MIREENCTILVRKSKETRVVCLGLHPSNAGWVIWVTMKNERKKYFWIALFRFEDSASDMSFSFPRICLCDKRSLLFIYREVDKDGKLKLDETFVDLLIRSYMWTYTCITVIKHNGLMHNTDHHHLVRWLKFTFFRRSRFQSIHIFGGVPTDLHPSWWVLLDEAGMKNS